MRLLKKRSPWMLFPLCFLVAAALSLGGSWLSVTLRSGFSHEGARLTFISDDGMETRMRDGDGNALSYMYISGGGTGFAVVTYGTYSFMFSASPDGSVFTFSDGSRLTHDGMSRFEASASGGGLVLDGSTLNEEQARDWRLYDKVRAVRDFRAAAFDSNGFLICCAIGVLLALLGAATATILPPYLKGGGQKALFKYGGSGMMAAAAVLPAVILFFL